MALTLKQMSAVTEMATVLYSFLPGSGSQQWRGHVTFQSVATDVGVGDFWQPGSKQPAIVALLEKTLENRPILFERLILTIVRESMTYRRKRDDPIKREEITRLAALALNVGLKIPDLWDPSFLESLDSSFASPPARTTVQPSSDVDRSKRLPELHSRFFALWAEPDRQQAGLALEGLLNDLFHLFNLAPRSAFRVTGEQIDGSFTLDGEIYLVEAKWEKDALSEAPLVVFHGKVESKSVLTRGVFVSISGCTSTAIDAFTRGRRSNLFLVDGYDLTVVLEGRIELPDLLRRKLRRLAEEGRVYISARELRV